MTAVHSCVSAFVSVTPLDHFKETSGQQQTSFVATKLGVFAKKSGHLQPKHDFFPHPNQTISRALSKHKVEPKKM